MPAAALFSMIGGAMIAVEKLKKLKKFRYFTRSEKLKSEVKEYKRGRPSR
jgi:hypothetical protein